MALELLHKIARYREVIKEKENVRSNALEVGLWMSLSEAVTFEMCPYRQVKRQGRSQKGAGRTGSAGILGKH